MPANENQAGQCLIKGNVGRGGERIYHIPGGAYYGRTKIAAGKGERRFCTEAESVATVPASGRSAEIGASSTPSEDFTWGIPAERKEKRCAWKFLAAMAVSERESDFAPPRSWSTTTS